MHFSNTALSTLTELTEDHKNASTHFDDDDSTTCSEVRASCCAHFVEMSVVNVKSSMSNCQTVNVHCIGGHVVKCTTKPYF